MVSNQMNEKLTAATAESGPQYAACEQYLLQRYGATMSLSDIAIELRTTVNALRIRQYRLGDLPPAIQGMRGYLCPTTVVAEWISGLARPSHAPSNVVRTAAAPVKRRGRPRKRFLPGVSAKKCAQ